MDLVIAVVHKMVSFVEYELDQAELTAGFVRDLVDLFFWLGYRTHARSDNSMAEVFAKRGFYMDGRHLCGLGHDHDFSEYQRIQNLINCTKQRPQYLTWSTAHDKDCRYHGSGTGLVVHWCKIEAPLPGYHDIKALLDLCTKAGDDVSSQCSTEGSPMDIIFDITLLEHGSDYRIEIMARKFVCLVEHGVRPQLTQQKQRALSRAVMLRGKCIDKDSMLKRLPVLRKFSRKVPVEITTLRILDAIIKALRHFKKTSTWPEEELDYLKKVKAY